MTGAALVNPMIARLAELGVEIKTGVAATELIVADGAVVGVKAVSDEADYTINAKAVILATGGFDASTEMKAKYSPIAAADFPLSAKGNVGDGINMGIAIGAATEFKGGMIGFDFVNGSLPASGMNAVAMYCVSYTQPDGTFVSPVIDYPITYQAIKDLGVDHFYGLYDAAGAQSGLTTAPYYAVMVAPCTIGSMGGLVINTDAQVMGADGNAIAGLYASGEVANGGFYYQVYPCSGSSLSLAMTSALRPAATLLRLQSK